MSGNDEQARRALADALALAAAGYLLTAVTIDRRADGKKGATFHGNGQTGKAFRGWRHEDAWTSDPEQLRAWWVDHPDTSFALRTGHVGGVDVVDLDVGEHDAVLWWAEQGHPVTAMVVATPSGGMHLYAAADDLPTTAGVFAPGVDTRGDGGLVFAPGGYVVGEAGHYELQGPLVPVAALQPLPHDLAEAIRTAAPAGKTYSADGEVVVKDRPVIVNKCREQLAALAALPPRTGGSLFRDTQMGAAMMLGRLVESGAAEHGWALEQLERATVAVWGSISAADTANIVSGLADGPRKERWRFRPTTPPAAAQPGGLTRGTAPVAAAATDTASVHAHVSPPPLRLVGEDGTIDEADLAQYEDDQELARELRRRRVRRRADELERPPAPDLDELVVWDDALDTLPVPSMAIGKLLPDTAVGWLGGPSGSYKSFVAVSLAAALAYGVPALGHAAFAPKRTKRVLYAAGEGAPGVALRLRALRAHLGVARAQQLALYPRAIDLTSEDAVARMTAFALAHHIEHIVVDTFRQSTLGVNENDNTEVGLILGRLIEMRDVHGISSTLVDHTNKSAQGLADLGGAGAKRANADYVLMVDLPNGDRGADQQRVLRVAKLKDSPDGQMWPIRLEQVDGVRDEAGVSSAVAVVGQVEADTEAWQRAGLAWTDRRWGLPADVDALVGAGSAAAQDLARYMRVQAADRQGTGESRAEAIRALQSAGGRGGIGTYGKDTTTLRRGWSRLVALGRLESFTADTTSKSLWVPKLGDAAAPEGVDPDAPEDH